MPCPSWGISPKHCMTGSRLRNTKGTVCEKCYACKGHYTMINTEHAHEQRLAALEHPRWTDAMVAQILLHTDAFFRWFDSGDVQSKEHAEKILDVARRTPSVAHWIPSLELSIWNDVYGAIPRNVTVRISSPLIDKHRPNKTFNTSLVKHADKDTWTTLVQQNSQNLWHCPAPLQDNKCLACRACWDKDIKTVAYRQH